MAAPTPSTVAGGSGEATTPVIRFRNYKPSAATVAAAPTAVAVEPITVAPSVLLREREEAEKARLIAEHTAKIAAYSATTAGPSLAAGAGGSALDDLAVTIAPKKPNWDLKRDVEKKLEVLERRTARAMADLVRDEALAHSAAASGAGGELAAGVDAAVLARAVTAADGEMGEGREGRVGGRSGGAEDIDLDV